MSEIIVCKRCRGKGKLTIHQRQQHGYVNETEECPYCNGKGRLKQFIFTAPLDAKAVRFIAIGKDGVELNIGQSG